VNPQVYDLTSSSAFADLAGSPPKAAYIAVVNRFLVISGLASPNDYRIQWSGLNDTTNWTSGVNDSDFQDLADGGVVRGVAGGEFGVIFQDRSIRRMTFQPGSDIVFGIDRISKDDGLLAPYSLVNAGDKIFFYSPRGFEKIESGLAPQQIGKERVDRTFAMDLDANNLQLFIGGVDPQKPRVFFVYKSVNSGVSTQFDSMLVYDWILDRWSKISMSGEFIASLARNGLTLEQVDAAYNTASPVSLTSVTTSTSAVTFGLVAHGLTAGQGIIFPNAIVGLAANTPYYVKSASLTSSSFNVSASGGVGTLAGAAVGTTSTSTGAVTTTFVQSSIDTLSIGSLDAITIATEPAFAMSQSNKVGFFTGNTLEATMETAEHASSPRRRIFVRGYKPICDAAGVVGNVSIRETQQATATHTSEATVDTLGNINARVSTRYARGKIRIPAGTDWSFAAGIEPDVSQEGER
jgi:hypothetical protein